MTSGFENIRRNKDTKFEVDTDGEAYGANTKKRFAFIDIMEADLHISELISGTKDGARANLRVGAGVEEMVNFRGAKNLGEDGVKINIRNDVDAEKMVNFKGTTIVDGINVN